jgi:hypothetical protein
MTKSTLVVQWRTRISVLSCPLTPNFVNTRNSFKIKHSTVKVVMLSPLIFNRSNAHKTEQVGDQRIRQKFKLLSQYETIFCLKRISSKIPK